MSNTVRILADGSVINAGPKPSRDDRGILCWYVDPDSVEILSIDWTGFLGTATITTATWTADGLTITGSSTSGATTSCKISSVPLYSQGTAELVVAVSDGRTAVRRFRFYGREQ